LNNLFGTTFDVMDEAQRKQTTKGRPFDYICMLTRNMAFQGDGFEYPDNGCGGHRLSRTGRCTGVPFVCKPDSKDFERRSALFSLSISEVLIVNLWEHQVGLYQGANMGLFKTVFEVNLQLFQQTSASPAPTNRSTKERALLLFVIRDHVGATPLENLVDTLTADLRNIWSNLAKPPGLESCVIEDYFDFQFTALPHKLLQPDAFTTSVSSLRTRYSHPSAELT
jgi:protein SEY1